MVSLTILALAIIATAILPPWQTGETGRRSMAIATPHPAGEPPAQPPARPTLVLQPPITLSVKTTRLPATESDGSGPFHHPLRLAPPYAVLDSTRFKAGDATIRLAFVEGIRREEICLDDKGLRYACGLRGRASLSKLIAGKDLTCWPAFEPLRADQDDQRWQCFTGAGDLAAGQVAAGYARPTMPSAFPYKSGENSDSAVDGLDDGDVMPE